MESRAPQIRAVRLRDINHVAEIERLCFRDPYPAAFLYALALFHGDTFLVAELEGEIVGYVSAALEGEKRAHLMSIAVHPKFREKGFGSQLLKSLIKLVKAKGAQVIELEVRVSNSVAQALYRAFGFVRTRTLNRYYEDGEDAVTMSLRL